MIICPIYNFEEYNTYGPAKRHILLYKTRNFPLHVDLKKKPVVVVAAHDERRNPPNKLKYIKSVPKYKPT